MAGGDVEDPLTPFAVAAVTRDIGTSLLWCLVATATLAIVMTVGVLLSS
jgi:hypothetical protein